MKNFKLKIGLLMWVFFPILLSAQSPADKLFEKYSEKDGFTSVYITQHMFSLFADIETEEDKDGFVELVKNLNCIKIISVDDETPEMNAKVNFYDEIMKELPRDQYNELMVVKEKDSDVVFLAREVKGVIVELLLIAGGKSNSDNVLISIQGIIDLENIAKLSHGLGIEGMKSLEDLEKLP